jgi:hypothetical protein
MNCGRASTVQRVKTMTENGRRTAQKNALLVAALSSFQILFMSSAVNSAIPELSRKFGLNTA